MTTAGRALGWALVLSAAIGCVGSFDRGASKHGYFYRPRPLWQVTGGGGDLGCATADLWVSKSGVEGVGLTLALRAKQAACPLTLERLTLTLAGGAAHGTTGLPVAMELQPGATAVRYLPVRFDNGAAWRDGVVTAAVSLAARSDAGAQTVRFELQQRRAQAPSWGTARGGPTLPCRGGELLVTETGASHVQAVLRLHPASACTLRVVGAELWDAGALIQRIDLQLPVVTRAEEPVEIPLRWQLDGGRGRPRDARIRIAVAAAGEPSAWHDWNVLLAPERGR